MEINVANAVKHFYANPSLEMVYYEAVANAIDARATRIDIRINIADYNEPETLQIEIEDNGEGFISRNFNKFTKLLEIEDPNHKGIGRLVYLHYFNRIEVKSDFDGKRRTFTFSSSFKVKDKLVDIESKTNSTILSFFGYSKKSIKSYEYLKPSSIKRSLEIEFFPVLHNLKIKKSDLNISIALRTAQENREYDFYSDTQVISIEDLPEFEMTEFDAEGLDMFQKMDMHYSIRQDYKSKSLITAVCAEGRTIPLQFVPIDNIPIGFEIIFLLYSDFFNGKVNSSRDKLELEDTDMRALKRLYVKNVGRILSDKIPFIKKRNDTVTETLSNRYPHLQGYFEKETAGLINQNKSLETAQKRFFNAQKEILDSDTLSEKQYEKSLELSARLLMEYVLYRTKIIGKLNEINPNSLEADIHKIIVPMQRSFHKSSFMDDIYTNNAWLLDDKYMTYSSILSNEEMTKLITGISLETESVERDASRPDIALIFSNDPATTTKVDVVIVELKKLGLGLAKKEEVVSQLRQRARKLLQYFPDKIQRIWFYGIVDIDKEFRISLKEDGYTELFSADQVFYKEQSIIIDEGKPSVLAGIYILSFDAFLKDAERRNSTFLNILKEGMKKHGDEPIDSSIDSEIED